MSCPRIHPIYCRCDRCAAEAPFGTNAAPSLLAAILAVAAIGAVGALLWLADTVNQFLCTWSA